jgi:hypothetical protein
MEELQSSEVLDREILEDARRKAQRILRTAEETAAAGTKSWEKKAQDAIGGIKRRYAERIDRDRSEIMARLPLDKRRSRLEKIDTLLHSAASAYLESLAQEKMAALLAAELEKRAGELGTTAARPGGQASGEILEFRVSFRGLSKGELEAMLGRIFTGARWTVGENSPYMLPGSFPALILDAPAVRISVSADGVVEDLLKDKRAELTAALLGEEALDA